MLPNNTVNLLEFIKNTNQILIPIYHRPYCWTRNEAEYLWTNIENTMNYIFPPSIFMGTILYTKDKSNIYIIDGQQRLLTISLLLKAISFRIRNNTSNDITEDKIKNNYLINPLETDDRKYKFKYKLIPYESDKKKYFSIIDNNKEIISEKYYNNNIENVFAFFMFKIKWLYSINEVKKLFKIISELSIFELSVDEKKQQLNFDIINSCYKSMPLSTRIKNFLFTNLDDSTMKYLYDNYWEKLESEFVNDEKYFNYLICKYLSVKLDRYTISRENLFEQFKQYCNKSNKKSEEILQEIFELAFKSPLELVSEKELRKILYKRHYKH